MLCFGCHVSSNIDCHKHILPLYPQEKCCFFSYGRRIVIWCLWLSCRQSWYFFFPFLLDNQKTFSIKMCLCCLVPKSPLGRQRDFSHRAADCIWAKVAGPLPWVGTAKGLGWEWVDTVFNNNLFQGAVMSNKVNCNEPTAWLILFVLLGWIFSQIPPSEELL